MNKAMLSYLLAMQIKMRSVAFKIYLLIKSTNYHSNRRQMLFFKLLLSEKQALRDN